MGLLLADLSAALRRTIAREDRALASAQPSTDPPALVGTADHPTLLARLDATRPYSAERDALLGALLRQHQERRDGAALGALLYALHEGASKRGRRLTTAPCETDEARAQILCALVESLVAFDLERRSRHVQANVELDTLKRLRLALVATRRRQRAENTTALVADAASDGLASETYTLADLLEPAEVEASGLDDDDRAAARVLLQVLVMEGLLRTGEALLVVRVDALGHRIVDVGRDLGMAAATARKTLERARSSLRRERSALRSIFLSRSYVDPALPW